MEVISSKAEIETVETLISICESLINFIENQTANINMVNNKRINYSDKQETMLIK